MQAQPQVRSTQAARDNIIAAQPNRHEKPGQGFLGVLVFVIVILGVIMYPINGDTRKNTCDMDNNNDVYISFYGRNEGTVEPGCGLKLRWEKCDETNRISYCCFEFTVCCRSCQGQRNQRRRIYRQGQKRTPAGEMNTVDAAMMADPEDWYDYTNSQGVSIINDVHYADSLAGYVSLGTYLDKDAIVPDDDYLQWLMKIAQDQEVRDLSCVRFHKKGIMQLWNMYQ